MATATPPTTPTGPYRVQLDAYAGPLDLLLHLVKQHEIDLHDIPIAKLTTQYLAHLDQMARSEKTADADAEDDAPITLDVDRAGEFLVMAATLVEIKSAMLMPRIEAEEADDAEAAAEAGDESDPRFELVRQLLAYKKFKDAANLLEQHRDAWADRFPAGARTPKPVATSPEDDAEDSSPLVELDLEDLGVNDLTHAFARLLDSIGFVGDHKVTYDETPISLHAEDIADRLQRDGTPQPGSDTSARGMSLRELFVGRQSRSEMIGLFLATLELVRQRRVQVTQPDTGGDIRLVLRPESDRNDLDGSDDAKALAAVAESAPKDLTLDEVAGFDWPDEATRRRVERRIRLRAAHRDGAAETDVDADADPDQPPDADPDQAAEPDPES